MGVLVFAVLSLGWYLGDILSYLLISLVISALLRTPTNYLANIQLMGLKMPRGVAVAGAFILLFGLLSLFVYLFVPLVSQQIKLIGRINFNDFFDSIEVPVRNFEEFLIRNKLRSGNEKFLFEDLTSSIANLFKGGKVEKFVNGVLQFTGNFFFGIIAVLFITFFFLYEPGNYKKYFISLIPNKYFEVSIAAVSKTENLLSNYLLGLFVQMISIFSLASIGLLIVGVEYAVTIAVFAAVANLIPFMGPILGAIFGLIVGISTNPGLPTEEYLIIIVKIVSVFAVVQLTDNIFLQPMIFSKSVKTHPLVIFLAVVIGSSVGGILGMILAIPTYTMLRVMAGEFYKGYREYQVFRNDDSYGKVSRSVYRE
ncbi:AI-2E family transporter [Algivirga pacifica]|uniref:AI-2E family transporter n=2 Tax=Algivirga pacifica TaxID=1162670 RepID=A0ABP9D0F6_9BACT